ncbi:M56 family metallopeptidase [Bengtsoniella intestinalis]|uniref:M56 family metallopeptidase n=1 Tax=Bengtsoniella intestinalis TaxID=3073143 RepID=UPI00391F39EF
MTQWILSSSVLIVCIVALRRLLRGRITQRVQYALWGLVLVRLLVPVQFGSSAISVNNVTQESEFLITQEAILPTVTVDTPTAELIPTLEPTVPVETTPQLPPVGTVVTALWITGSIAVGLWFGYTNLRFGRMLKRNRVLLDDDSTKLPVYMVEDLSTPCLFGSAIYVTPATVDNPQQLAHVLSHEGNHHRHGDHIWSLLRCVCLVVHWYNPLVWCAAVLSSRDCELACDEATMAGFAIADRMAYGRTLLEMTCAQTPSLLMTASTMVGGKKTLKERIGRIANKPNMARYTVIGLSVVVMCVIGFTFTGAEAKDIAIIGGADGPTAVFETEIVESEVDIVPEVSSAVLDIEVTQQLATPTGASIQLLVTATELDSVLLYTGWEEGTLNNYRFDDETEGTLFDKPNETLAESKLGGQIGTIGYVYSDEDSTLQDNQFYLNLTVNNMELKANQPYTLQLSKFGTYVRNQDNPSGDGVSMTPLYDEVWTVEIVLSADEAAVETAAESTVSPVDADPTTQEPDVSSMSTHLSGLVAADLRYQVQKQYESDATLLYADPDKAAAYVQRQMAAYDQTIANRIPTADSLANQLYHGENSTTEYWLTAYPQGDTTLGALWMQCSDTIDLPALACLQLGAFDAQGRLLALSEKTISHTNMPLMVTTLSYPSQTAYLELALYDGTNGAAETLVLQDGFTVDNTSEFTTHNGKTYGRLYSVWAEVVDEYIAVVGENGNAGYVESKYLLPSVTAGQTLPVYNLDGVAVDTFTIAPIVVENATENHWQTVETILKG